MTRTTIHTEYHDWLRNLKQQIKTGQIKAALPVNSQMIMLYIESNLYNRQGKAVTMVRHCGLDPQSQKQWRNAV